MGSDHFHKLVQQLRACDIVVDEAFLHGLLTGYATIPAMDVKMLSPAIAGEHSLADRVIEEVLANICALAADLSAAVFRAHFDHSRMASARQWLDGYFKAVKIHESDWEALNSTRPRAAASLIALHSMNDVSFHRGTKMNLPGPNDLEDDPHLVTDLVQNIFDRFHDIADDDFLPFDSEWSPLPDLSEAGLSAMSEAALMMVVTTSGDALPVEAIKECARRGDAMVPLLLRHLESDTHWRGDGDPGDWWALLHATMILGLIPGEDSARALLYAFRRITVDQSGGLLDWVSSSWPALCRNKKAYTTAPLKQIAEDKKMLWYTRSQAVDCVLADAYEQNSDELDRAIDWLAAMCADATEDTEFRVVAGHGLLDFPRERHRRVMEALVDLQEPGSLVANAYTRDEIQRSFDVGDSPEWQRFDNPWRFYEPTEIMSRRERWLREAGEPESDPWATGDFTRVETYVRGGPKIGRNDPCPCGSGKKYKKCCMLKLH